MSFLKELTDKRRSLRKTETTVTRADGRKYREKDGEKLGDISVDNYGFVVDYKPDDIPAKIADFLYLGSQDCCDVSVLSKYDITCVLSVGIEPHVKANDVNYKFVPCLDLPETDINEILKTDCFDYIKNSIDKKRNILVHCNAGISRSSAIVVGYLMLANNSEYRTCYDVVKNARSSIVPNVGFAKQLQCLK